MDLVHKVLHKVLHKVHCKNQKFVMKKRKPKQMVMTQKFTFTISEIDDATQSTQDSCYSWSSVSQEIDIKCEKKRIK